MLMDTCNVWVVRKRTLSRIRLRSYDFTTCHFPPLSESLLAIYLFFKYDNDASDIRVCCLHGLFLLLHIRMYAFLQPRTNQ